MEFFVAYKKSIFCNSKLEQCQGLPRLHRFILETLKLFKISTSRSSLNYRLLMSGIWLFFSFFFFAGDDELHPIQYYPEPPSKSDNKLISSLLSTDSDRVLEIEESSIAAVEASANSLSDSLLHILDWEIFECCKSESFFSRTKYFWFLKGKKTYFNCMFWWPYFIFWKAMNALSLCY